LNGNISGYKMVLSIFSVNKNSRKIRLSNVRANVEKFSLCQNVLGRIHQLNRDKADSTASKNAFPRFPGQSACFSAFEKPFLLSHLYRVESKAFLIVLCNRPKNETDFSACWFKFHK